jgi:hypothetical protein
MYISLVNDGHSFTLYINGEACSKTSSSSYSISSSSSNTQFQINGTTSATSFIIDEIRIYNRALSEKEIKALMDIGME